MSVEFSGCFRFRARPPWWIYSLVHLIHYKIVCRRVESGSAVFFKCSGAQRKVRIYKDENELRMVPRQSKGTISSNVVINHGHLQKSKQNNNKPNEVLTEKRIWTAGTNGKFLNKPGPIANGKGPLLGLWRGLSTKGERARLLTRECPIEGASKIFISVTEKKHFTQSYVDILQTCVKCVIKFSPRFRGVGRLKKGNKEFAHKFHNYILII